MLARQLQGRRILHLNATARGGGVAELLRSEVALQRGLGIAADWKVLEAPQSFFAITKMIHNGLQGEEKTLTPKQWSDYESMNAALAARLQSLDYELIIVHDPQPAASRLFVKGSTSAKWLWRCHIDMQHALPDYRQHLRHYLEPYDGAIFTMAEFVPALYKPEHLAIIPVAIDPLSKKNQRMSRGAAMDIVKGYGLDIRRPFITQVSRFDPWKDPLGVIAAWRIACKQVPGLQLALVGDTATDDPQGSEILQQVRREAAGEDDIFIIANEADDRAVKAFQSASSAVLQKSLREGFGLTVTEAMWANTPVIGGNVGGIPLQIESGKNGYLAGSSHEAARYIIQLIRHQDEARDIAKAGHLHVRKHFLLPRMLRDDLRFYAEVLEPRTISSNMV